MASSPEMEPPGFQHVLAPPPAPPSPPLPSPPLSESPPNEIESLNPTSPDDAPPGFDKPNAWMVFPPPYHPADLPPPELETNPTENGNDLQEAASVGDILHPQLAQLENVVPVPVPVPVKKEAIHSFQTGCAMSDNINLEPLLEEPKNETPMENHMLGVPEPHFATPQKIEILDAAMLVVPSQPLDASEQTLALMGDGLGETSTVSEVFYQQETGIKEETQISVLKPETVPWEDAPSEGQTMPLTSVPMSPSAVPDSVPESFSLPPSPPPIPMVSESIAPESSCENLNSVVAPSSLPPPPPAPPDFIAHYMPKSPVLNSVYEHEAMAPEQPPLTLQEPNIPDAAIFPPLPPPPPLPSPPRQLKCESVVPVVPEMNEVRHDNLQPLEEVTQDPSNQEMEKFSCSLGDGSSDMLPFETSLPVNQSTDEPPLKKSRNTYEAHDQVAEDCQSEDEDPFESVTPEIVPHQYNDMEQVDMEMSDDDTLDRSPADVGPPGNDTRDFESAEEAPPGYGAIDRTSQMEMISRDAFSGMGQMVCGFCKELISYPHGALHVLCTSCQTINLVLQACQVGTITCGQCSVLLMYPFGAPSVRCSCCRYVTEIGVHNMRPPLSVQQGDSYPTLVSIN